MDSLVVGTVPSEPEVNIDVDGLVDELSAARLEVDRFVSNVAFRIVSKDVSGLFLHPRSSPRLHCLFDNSG